MVQMQDALIRQERNPTHLDYVFLKRSTFVEEMTFAVANLQFLLQSLSLFYVNLILWPSIPLLSQSNPLQNYENTKIVHYNKGQERGQVRRAREERVPRQCIDHKRVISITTECNSNCILQI